MKDVAEGFTVLRDEHWQDLEVGRRVLEGIADLDIRIKGDEEGLYMDMEDLAKLRSLVKVAREVTMNMKRREEEYLREINPEFTWVHRRLSAVGTDQPFKLAKDAEATWVKKKWVAKEHAWLCHHQQAQIADHLPAKLTVFVESKVTRFGAGLF